MDFAYEAEDLAEDRSGVVDDGDGAGVPQDFPVGSQDFLRDREDFLPDGEGFPGDADDLPGDPADSGVAPGEPPQSAEPAEPPEPTVPAELAEPAKPRPATGEPRVDAALARLDELAGCPVTEHRAVFEDVHRRLRDVLGELDSRQQPPSRDATDAAGRPGR